jgi:putative endonuclease
MHKADATGQKSTAEPSLGSVWRRHPAVRTLFLRFAPLYRRVSLRLLGIRLSRAETGLLGELLAARHLQERGRTILRRNHRGPHRGEVDIVARHGEVLTFVEVKTRTSSAFGRPADAVTADKQRLIQRGALDWLRLLGNPRIAIRFDIAEVLLIDGEVPRVNLIENAFTLPDSSMAGR